MANLKAAIRSIRVDKKRTERNLKYKADLKTLIKVTKKAILAKEKNVDEQVKKIQQQIDKMVQRKTMHRNAAARTLSRIHSLKNSITKK